MAVALRAYTQGTTQASGTVSIAWPTGTAAGDLAVVVAQDYSTNGPQTSGWTRYGEGVWCKRVTSTDIATSLTVKGRTTFLQTFTGAAGIGRVRWSHGMTLTTAGAGLFVDGWGPSRITTLTPGATGRLGSQIRLVTDDTPNAVWFVAASSAVYTSLSDHDDDATYVAYEILPTAAPNPPTLVTPAAGTQYDTTQTVPFTWQHQSQSSGSQEAFQLQIRHATPGAWYYAVAAGTSLTLTETTITSSAQGLTLAAGVLTTGTLYDWRVRTRESGTWSDWSTVQQLKPVAAPTVTSITVTAPAGDLTPVVDWTVTAGVGSQEAWHVRICASADATPDTPLWDSLVTAGTALTTTPPATTGWTNAATLYAWVRVQQTGGLWSAWTKDNVTFAVTWTSPTAPTSVTVSNATTPPRVTISSAISRDGWQLEWYRDGEWTAYTEAVQSGSGSIYVYVPLCPYGAAVDFRARVFTIVDGVRLYSAWASASAFTSTDTASYVVDAEDPSVYLAVDVLEDAGRSLVQGVSVTYGLGSTRARVDRGQAQGEAGSTTLLTWTLAERDALVTWLTERDSWWLRWSPERADATVDVPATLMALAGKVGWDRLAQLDISPRRVTFPWVEQ